MKIECLWTIYPTNYVSDLPFGEPGLSVVEESEIILQAYNKLDGSRFQPKKILISDTAMGWAMMDYLTEKSLPVELIWSEIRGLDRRNPSGKKT